MSAPQIYFLYNNSQSDTPNVGGKFGDSRWNLLDPINDKVVFLGSGTEDGDDNDSGDVFIIPKEGQKEIPRHFVNDYSSQKFERVWLAGSDADEGEGGNYRYAYGAYIDGTTASVPVLQAWDSTSLVTYGLEVLGAGNPANSLVRAICTTNAAPGSEWAGIPLAGDGESNSVVLDSAPIGIAKMVYWNMRLLIPSTANEFTLSPVLTIYITYS